MVHTLTPTSYGFCLVCFNIYDNLSPVGAIVPKSSNPGKNLRRSWKWNGVFFSGPDSLLENTINTVLWQTMLQFRLKRLCAVWKLFSSIRRGGSRTPVTSTMELFPIKVNLTRRYLLSQRIISLMLLAS